MLHDFVVLPLKPEILLRQNIRLLEACILSWKVEVELFFLQIVAMSLSFSVLFA